MKRLALPLILLSFPILAACTFSLAEDITPPPGYQQPVFEGQAPVSAPDLQPPAAAPDLERGAAIYAESCAPCHGERGLGDGDQAGQLPNPVPAIGAADLARQAVPLDWYAVVTEGQLERFMPPFANSLSDQERWDVLAYVYSLSISPEALAQGEALYQETCAGCHGQAGAGDGSALPAGAGQPPDFSDPAFMAGKAVASHFGAISLGITPSMPAYESQFGDNERWQLAHFVQSLAFSPGTARGVAQAEPAVEGAGTDAGAGEEAVAEESGALPEAATAGTGRVTGVVVNGSGGEVPPDLVITLHGFDHIEEVFTTSTAIEEDGSFSFEEVAMPDSRIFMVTTDFGGATYNSDLAIVEPETDAMNLPVTIYETTTDTSMLQVDRLHLFVESLEPGLLQVTELYLISNPTDKVVIAPEEEAAVVNYSLPPGATNLRFQTGTSESRFIPTENGFADTMGVPPGSGQYQVMFAYDMPYNRQLELEHQLSLPVHSVVLLVPEIGLRIRSDQLQDNGARDIQGVSYRIFTSEPIDAGDRLAFSLSGRLKGSGGSVIDLNGGDSTLLGLVALGGAVVVAGVWFYARRRRNTSDSLSVYPDVDTYDTPETIMDAIIALDDLYRAGELPEGAYRERRAELKARLHELLNGQEEG